VPRSLLADRTDSGLEAPSGVTTSQGNHFIGWGVGCGVDDGVTFIRANRGVFDWGKSASPMNPHP